MWFKVCEIMQVLSSKKCLLFSEYRVDNTGKPQDNGNISLLSYEDLIEYIGQAGKSVYPCYLVLG